MHSVFKNTPIKNMDKNTENLGKKYVDMTLTELMSNNTSINSLYDIYDRNKTRFNR